MNKMFFDNNLIIEINEMIYNVVYNIWFGWFNIDEEIYDVI